MESSTKSSFAESPAPLAIDADGRFMEERRCTDTLEIEAVIRVQKRLAGLSANLVKLPSGGESLEFYHERIAPEKVRRVRPSVKILKSEDYTEDRVARLVRALGVVEGICLWFSRFIVFGTDGLGN